MAKNMFDIPKAPKTIYEKANYTSGSSVIEKPDQEHSISAMAFESVPNINKRDFNTVLYTTNHYSF